MQVEVGSILEAKVTGITKFGAFVRFDNEQTAMVHISEIAPTYVNDIADYLTVGQVVKVKILNMTEEGKVSASIKRTLPAPERPAHSAGPRPASRPPQVGGTGGSRGGAPRPAGGAGSRPARGSNARASMASQFPGQPAAFEDMLSKFMQTSDDKMADMKKTMNVKHSNSRRGGGKH